MNGREREREKGKDECVKDAVRGLHFKWIQVKEVKIWVTVYQRDSLGLKSWINHGKKY